MPGMNGLETTTKIRESNKSYKDVKIIAWSASIFDQVSKEYLNAGMNDFSSKPVKPKKLYQKIMALVQN